LWRPREEVEEEEEEEGGGRVNTFYGQSLIKDSVLFFNI
jgi:hypothetical protein